MTMIMRLLKYNGVLSVTGLGGGGWYLLGERAGMGNTISLHYGSMILEYISSEHTPYSAKNKKIKIRHCS